ncbi:retinol dehydrogenase 12-like isoform X2 [Acanthaster planci]|uniref:Retinol dehydrogenase 12-like isoform X2 n=1 Tax=Acanthaster planci TaxID=133434 RepID=A0A8B7YGT9_ACAPL|nr:retinol dehydrogenase 12-like isoform X2 [Acanthaster planci]
MAIERMQKEHKNEVLKSRSVRASGQHSSTAEEAEVKPLNVEYIKLDLSSLQSTMDFIRETKQRMQSLNVLVCNAGIAFVQQGYTEDNYELHFQVNYLSHFLIALHLMPLLRAGAPDSRIVFLSSVAHSSGKLDLDNMQCRKSYSRYGAYASSKAYVVMAACLLARRLKGTGVSTFAVDPGVVNTDIQRNFSDWRLLSFFMGAYSKMGMMRTPKKGAATSVVACIQPSLSGRTAVFMKNCQPANPASFCRDEANQEKLWNYTLGCLSQFINDDALKEAFPFAEPDLLVIPKNTETVEEQIADELGKQEGSPDGKEGCQPRGGEASFASKKEETEPEKEHPSEAAEVASETVQITQEANGYSSGEKMRGDAPEDEEKPTRCEVAGEERSEKEPSSEGAEKTSETIHIMQEGNGDASGVKMQGDAPEDKEKE